MSPARRARHRKEWPRGLYEPRPGYYVWRHPNGKTYALGSIALAEAKAQVIAANAHLAATKPSLLDKISGGEKTMAALLLEMPAPKSANTAKSWRSLDKIIKQALGSIRCDALTVSDCAELIEGIAESGKARSAEAVRSRLIAVCTRGRQLGWMDNNPAEVTARPDVKVKRGRLTLEMFKAIYAKAPEVSEWLPLAMRYGLVLGADVSTLSGLQRSMVADGWLTFARSKTGAAVAIPTALKLDCMGWSLADLVAERTGVLSRYLIHHVNPWGNAPPGSRVHKDTISRAFTAARKLAGIPDEGAPTAHEMRSLCKRLYDAQGGVDTKALLQHSTERMAAIYADPRGVEPVRVRVQM